MHSHHVSDTVNEGVGGGLGEKQQVGGGVTPVLGPENRGPCPVSLMVYVLLSLAAAVVS